MKSTNEINIKGFGEMDLASSLVSSHCIPFQIENLEIEKFEEVDLQVVAISNLGHQEDQVTVRAWNTKHKQYITFNYDVNKMSGKVVSSTSIVKNFSKPCLVLKS